MLKLPQSSPGLGRLPAYLALVLVAIASPLSGQNRLRANTAAPLLKDPNGIRLATLVSGATYQVGRTREGHVQVTLEGWLPTTAVQATTRDGFDLVVTAGSGERLRSGPGTGTAARLQEGTLLNRAETRGNWVRVRRDGWVVRSGLSDPTVETAAAPAPPPARSAAAATPPPATPPAAQASAATPSADSARVVRQAPVSSDAGPGSGVAPGMAGLRAGTGIATTRDGKPVATFSDPSTVSVLERDGEWMRVRMEGWVRAEDVTGDAPVIPSITGAMIREAPERFVGQAVTWRLQFLAVQEADVLRPEMPPGQPYLLARGPLPESGFTYVMVTRDQAAQFRRMTPLDEVTVEAVLRAGRTKFLPTPVLELVRVIQP